MADEHDPQCRARLAVVVEAARALLRELGVANETLMALVVPQVHQGVGRPAADVSQPMRVLTAP